MTPESLFVGVAGEYEFITYHLAIPVRIYLAIISTKNIKFFKFFQKNA